ncbi:MAG: 4-(cytidine 5'-diphospho)-2-C-methyl-D-erythritol kinase, partial [Caulobacteraceae bacterium]|nr:4-(cytidine 5'-diphospho)-2-C-methyl-D-erythritol kinase [Caulobacteraceae bacterium]
ALERLAASLGSDGAACLFGRPVIAEGRGERLSPAPVLPQTHAVLVNPGVSSPTGPVYRKFDQLTAAADIARPPLPASFEGAEHLAEVLQGLRNDLEAPAVAINPVIGEALQALKGAGSLLARVSGSGATCFSLCASEAAAVDLAARIAAARPLWWVRPCLIGGPWG